MKSNSQIYKSGNIEIREKIIESDNGDTHSRIFLDMGCDAVLIIPQDSDANYIMCSQKREHTEKTTLEFPSGGIKDGEDPKAAATRELKEELGITNGDLQYLGEFQPLLGLVNLKVHVFHCKDAIHNELDKENDTYEDISTKVVSPDELNRRIKGSEINDGYVFAALGYLNQYNEKYNSI